MQNRDCIDIHVLIKIQEQVENVLVRRKTSETTVADMYRIQSATNSTYR